MKNLLQKIERAKLHKESKNSALRYGHNLTHKASLLTEGPKGGHLESHTQLRALR